MATFRKYHELARKRLDQVDTDLEQLLVELDDLTLRVESGSDATELLEIRKATRLLLQAYRQKLDSIT